MPPTFVRDARNPVGHPYLRPSPAKPVQRSFGDVVKSMWSTVTSFSQSRSNDDRSRSGSIEEESSRQDNNMSLVEAAGLEEGDSSMMVAAAQIADDDLPGRRRKSNRRSLPTSTAKESTRQHPVHLLNYRPHAGQPMNLPRPDSGPNTFVPAIDFPHTSDNAPGPSKLKRSHHALASSASAPFLINPAPAASTPTSTSPDHYSPNASRAALAAFLQAKGDSTMSPSDIKVMESCVAGIRAENDKPPTPPEIPIQIVEVYKGPTGNWSAGRSIRPMKTLPASTPARLIQASQNSLSQYSTPGSTFSPGSVHLYPTPSSQPRMSYLGPGMSPRRSRGPNRLTQTSLRKAVQIFDRDDNHEIKKRRTGQEGRFELEDEDMPEDNAPSTNKHSSTKDVIKEGKRRAADILQDLITSDLDSSSVLQTPLPQVEINPYEQTPTPNGHSFSNGSSSTPLKSNRKHTSSLAKSILHKSMLKSSTSSPARGAAAKLGFSPSSKKLSTVEILQGQRAWNTGTTPVKNAHKNLETPSRNRDDHPIEDLYMSPGSPERSPSPVTVPPQKTKMPQQTSPEPTPPAPLPQPTVQAKPASTFKVPTLISKAQDIPKYQSSSSFQTFDSPTSSSVLATSSKPASSAFSWQASPAKTTYAPMDDIEEPISSRYDKPRSALPTVIATGLYHTAKEMALQVAEVALPVYTFYVDPLIQSKMPSPSASVRAEALSRPIKEYSFTAHIKNQIVANIERLGQKVSVSNFVKMNFSDQPWTCETCMLQNPGSAKEKCGICEAPRPMSSNTAGQGGSSKPFSMFGLLPTKSKAGEWTCSLCMLKNEPSAQDQCQFCEQPRPQSSAALPKAEQQSILVPPTATPFTGFGANFGAFNQVKPGEWTCGTCSLKNPASATEKCTICETPKP